MRFDVAGNLVIADSGNNRIRAMGVGGGAVTTLAGSGAAGAADGVGVGASINTPLSLAWDAANSRLLVGELNGYTLRAIDLASGAVTRVAGVQGSMGMLDTWAQVAQTGGVSGLALAPDGSAYFSDWAYHRVRRVACPAPSATHPPRPRACTRGAAARAAAAARPKSSWPC
jgi:sugar lactone lactonase YvrE